MTRGLSQKVLDKQYRRINFKQAKGIDNSHIATEVIYKEKKKKMVNKGTHSATNKPSKIGRRDRLTETFGKTKK
jgi:predicted extracellular nuclease